MPIRFSYIKNGIFLQSFLFNLYIIDTFCSKYKGLISTTILGAFLLNNLARAQDGGSYATKDEEEMIKNGFIFFPPKKIKPSNDESNNLKSIAEPKTFSDITEQTVKIEDKKEQITIIETAQPKQIALPKNKANTPYLMQKYGTSVYASTGTELSIGIRTIINEKINMRVEYSYSNEPLRNKTIDTNNYTSKIQNERIGAYVDWFPMSNPFKLVAGITSNNISQKIVSQPSAQFKLNNNVLIFEKNDIYEINFKFPKYSPYLGIGFDFNNPLENKTGWFGFAEIGALIGKPDANVITSLVGNNGITNNDILEETKTLRRKLYRWDLIPKASIGLNYRY